MTPAERLRDLLAEVELADQLGLDVFGVGEHRRSDFVVSSPAVALAAVAERTREIRLTSAVSVLSSDDPVRVFQDFAMLDFLSGVRAEIVAGGGSFIESFPTRLPLNGCRILSPARAGLSACSQVGEHGENASVRLGTGVQP